MPVQTSVALSINAPLSQTFAIAAGFDPSALIMKYGPLPGIVKTDGHDAPWSAIGQQRKHTLSDNSSVNEELVAFTRDSTFAYRVTDFTGLFAALARSARGEWHFTMTGAEKTQIDWTYSFFPSGPVAEPLLWFVVKTLWPGYLRAALNRVKAAAEQGSHEDRDF